MCKNSKSLKETLGIVLVDIHKGLHQFSVARHNY